MAAPDFPFALSDSKRQLLEELLREADPDATSTTVPAQGSARGPAIGSAHGPAAGNGGEVAGPPPIRRRRDRTRAPLSYAQERLWFLDQLAPGNPFYNCDIVIPLGAVDPRALRRALLAVVRRHDQLRCALVRTPQGPEQRITDPEEATVDLDLVDLRRLPAADRVTAAHHLARRRAATPFDLAAGPLLRPTLIRIDTTNHLLVLVIHHIVCDGWSIRVLLADLWSSYNDLVSGGTGRLPALEVEYADVAAWQRSWLTPERLETDLEYWEGQLEGLRDLRLPADRVRPAVATYRGEFVPLHLPPSLVQRLAPLAGEEGATTFMVLLAGFCATLSRYAGTDDVAVGAPIANRTQRELEDMVGFFVNTLVLRVDLTGRKTLRELVRAVRDTALDAYRHQDLPFDRLVHHLRPDRDLSRNPLVQVVAQHFQMDRRAPGSSGDNLRETPPELARGTAKFDLRLDTWDAPDGIRGQLEYSLDVFERESAFGLLTSFVRLLQGGLADPDRPLDEVDLVSSAERAALVEDLNDTRQPYPDDGGVHLSVGRQARARPGAVAVVDGDTEYTYAQLWRASGALAAALRRRGLAAESMIAVALDRGMGVVVAQLGVLRAGCAYVPVDPGYPESRLSLILTDCRPPVLVTERRLLPALPAGDWEVLLLDDLVGELPAEQPDAEAEEEVAVPARADQLAYVMYTSGSTGGPKGVLVPHRGVARLAHDTDYVDLGPEDVVGFGSNIAFDAATFEIWATLVSGGRLVVLDRDTLLTPRALSRRVRQCGLTVLFQTTALFSKVMEEEPAAFATLETLLIGGSAFDTAAARTMYAAGPPRRFLNVYGPTENTTFSTGHLLPGAPGPDRIVPIGRPGGNSTAYVVDPTGRPVPVGMPGELWVGGDGVALGYRDRPALSAEKFVPDLFSERPGALLYRTGDRARMNRQHEIEFLGRLDRQVKVRGFRVELAEIENTLRDHPHVADAVVAAWPRGTGDPRLVAYVRVPGNHDDGGDAVDGDRGPAGDDDLVSQWRGFYDDVLYAAAGDPLAPEPADTPADPGDPGEPVDEVDTEDFAGWVSSYTGDPIPVETMREQVATTVDQVLTGSPRRVLDVGCGSGLVAYRVAPRVDTYVGTDFSDRAVRTLRRGLRARCPEGHQVRVEHLAAHELDRLETREPFDVVVLNSVAQYFPSTDYLDEVLAQAVDRTRDGGVVHVGDVRLLPLLGAFHTSVAAHRPTEDLTVGALAQRVASRVEQDNELVLSPDYFHRFASAMPRVHAVTVELKRGRHDSELTRFRADVRLVVGEQAPEPLPTTVWDGAVGLAELAERLRSEAPRTVQVTGIPNARLAADHALLEALARARADTAAAGVVAGAEPDAGAVDPDDVRDLLADLGYAARLAFTPGAETRTFDVLAWSTGRGVTPPVVTFPAPARRDDMPVATDPRRGNFLRRVVPELRAFATERLPDYMHPSAWVLLHDFPVDRNGKVDASRLPPVDDTGRSPAHTQDPPRTELERVVSDVWSLVLGIDRVGLREGFFSELGANSLLATQVTSRLCSRLGFDVPLRLLFEHPTVEQLAAAIDELDPGHRDPPVTDLSPADVDALSDEAVDDLLRQLMPARPPGRGGSDGHR